MSYIFSQILSSHLKRFGPYTLYLAPQSLDMDFPEYAGFYNC